ncbi:ArnT family glycosyltransferase [Robbsia andropogonis]|uniref:ArnT family glycosyltransferase n=1 Tax=Robbsia andropogonis TaxID=28092 RepID=UPI003D263BFE
MPKFPRWLGGRSRGDVEDIPSAQKLAIRAGTALWWPGNAGLHSLDARYAWFMAACATWLVAYLLPGIVGHEPWKQDETYTFGIITHFLNTHEWLIPTNAGQPFMEKPPLFMWTAAFFAWLMHPPLALYNAARFATLFYAALTLVFTVRAAACVSFPAKASPALPGPYALATRRFTVPATIALLAGTFLVVKHLHDLFSDVALIAGTAIGFAALCRIVAACAGSTAHSARHREAVLFGIGVGIAFLSKGVFVPGIFLLTTLTLPLCYRGCRTRRYWTAIGIALLSSAPFILVWPTLLYRASPALFMVWFWDNNIGRFLGFSVAQLGSHNEPGLVWKAMFGVCFPVGPLAFAGLLLGGWKRLREPALGVATLFCGVGLVMLGQSATVRQLYLLPFTVPAALLAADALYRLANWHPRSNRTVAAARVATQFATVGWDWMSRVLFGAFAILIWFVWAARSVGSAMGLIGPAQTAAPTHIGSHASLAYLARRSVDATEWLGRWLPLDFPLAIPPGIIAAAIMLTVCWLLLLRHVRCTGAWRGVMSWCAGLTLVWGLVNTLLLPWLDRAKGYGPVYRTLAVRWQHDWHAGDCVSSIKLGESEAPMLQYFTGRTPHPAGSVQALADNACRWVIVQHGTHTLPTDMNIDTRHKKWILYWDGARQGDTGERLLVYRDASRD